MADATTTSTKSDLEAEIARLRDLLDANGINPDQADPNHGVVGNFADVQRLGSLAASDAKTNIDDAVVIPPSVDPDSGDSTPAQTAAGDPPPESPAV